MNGPFFFSKPHRLLGLALAAASLVLAPASWGFEQPFAELPSEALTPLTVKPTPSPTTPATLPSATTPVSTSAVSSATSLAVVKGIVVTLSGTTGFARDTALDLAAKQGLPTVLERLPMPKATAASTAKSIGDAQKFVKSYTIIKETILPTYRLTVDLTYNEALLRKNFGGIMTKPATVSASTVTSASAPISATALTQAMPLQEFIKPEPYRLLATITADTPETVDTVVKMLESQPETQVLYTLLTADETRLSIQTPRSLTEIQTLVGTQATVTDATPTPAPALASPTIPTKP